MAPDAFAMLEGTLAAVPFLPPGKGALILMLGGLAMLALSLLFVRFFPGPPPSTFTPVARSRFPSPSPSTLAPVARSRAGAPPTPPAVSAGPPSPPAGFLSAATAAVPGTEWVAGLERTVGGLRLGGGRILTADPDRCVFFLTQCGSCQARGAGGHGCERERRLLELAVRPSAPQARVEEVACDLSGQGACRFEILRRGA